MVFNNILHSFLDKKSVYCLDVISDLEKPSTKQAVAALSNMKLTGKKVLLFLSAGDEVSFASFRNIVDVSVLFFDQPNAFDLSNSDCWVFLKKDLNLFKEMILRWN